jgi:hypothetical protein
MNPGETAMASKWDGIKSPKILDALRVALSDDKMFSHREVVDVIRAALDDGYLTPSELNDLRIVADNSETMLPRPRAMLRYLIEQTPKVYGAAGLFSLTTNRQQFAAETICSFLKRIGNGYFPHLDRDRVGIDLLLRVGNPEIINQDTAGLCGPVAFIYGLASDSPATYARYAVDLYEKGKATIGEIVIEPSKGCRTYSPPYSMSPADWITAASLRDSENWWFDVDDVKVGYSASATIGDIEKWFIRSGYTDVKYESAPVYGLDQSDIDDLNRYYSDGRRVVLRINSTMLYGAKQSDITYHGNHLVVLHSSIARTPQGVRLTIFTWGQGNFVIPQGTPLSEHDFLNNLYGYVAGKPF